MRKIRNYSIALLLTGATFFAACNKQEKPEEQKAPETTNPPVAETVKTQEKPSMPANVIVVGTVTPAKGKGPVEFTWQEGGAEKLFSEAAKGKVLLVNFWGTWCPPCREEIPALVEISKDLKDKDFLMVGVALERDPATALETVGKFASQNSIPYYVFVDAEEKLAPEYGKAFGPIEAVPTTYIFDKKGKLAQKIVGGKTKDEFMSYINKLL